MRCVCVCVGGGGGACHGRPHLELVGCDWSTASSAYEVKNNCCLFERLFKAKKNDVFLFGISFFLMEICTFLYYANEESDDVVGGSTKKVQHSINNISRSI